jgi:hypothetical protein
MVPDMTDAGRSASLLPYLEKSRGTSHLNISLATQEPSLLEKTTTPFLVIDDSDPLARLMEAQFLTDAGNLLRRVFLLVQRDQYRLAEDELWPVTNLDIENAWQHAFSFFNHEGKQRRLTILSSQITEGNGLSPLAPLFFCKRRQVFFCPPCPRCGTALQQCTDDGLLFASGLQPFSRSLKRYLSCPSCESRGPSDFYAYQLDDHDTPGLKDRWALINEFGLLLDSGKRVNGFPCRPCDSREECFRSDALASSRIVPFSFYPFHLLMIDAMSLHALEFLALLSGATCEELQVGLKAKGELGRLNCLRSTEEAGLLATPFLYDHHERFFLEVLYLKLSFLAEVAQGLPSTGFFEHPDVRFSLNRIWVTLTGQGGLLPSFWNFRAGPAGISGPPAESAAPQGSQPDTAPYFMGLVWFYTLLVNKRQDIAQVSRGLKEFLSREVPFSGPSPDTPVGGRRSPIFSPANMFWEPGDQDGKRLPGDWYVLWEKSLELGWLVWVAGVRGDPAWSREAFSRQLADLRQEVKGALFRQTSEPCSEPYAQSVVQPADDAAIHSVLVKMIARMRSEAGVEAETRPEPKIDTEQELTRTVILSPGSLRQEPSSPPTPDRREMQETVIVSVGSVKGETRSESAAAKEAGEEILETVIISAREAGKQAQLDVESKGSGPQDAGKENEKTKKPADDASLAETVMLSVEKKERGGR